MAKLPDTLTVRFTISNISLEVPKAVFEQAAIKAAVFTGRKGRGTLTRRTKWFSIADPSTVGSSTRHMMSLPTPKESANAPTVPTTKVGSDKGEESIRPVAGELAVLEYGGNNNIVYDVEMRPLNKFEDEWVFDHKLSHPLEVFVKIFVKMRPGAKVTGAKSEVDSHLNSMLQMDQSELDEENFSESGENAEEANDINEASRLSFTGLELTPEQILLVTGGKDEIQVLLDDLYNQQECKKRYLKFPKMIDLSTVMNTKSKTIEVSERLDSKSVTLLGCVLSFTITAEVNDEKLAKYEEKHKDQEDQENRKRREKEGKLLEKERKKKGEKKQYADDLGQVQDEKRGAVSATEAGKEEKHEDASKKSGFAPFQVVKGIFSSKLKKVLTTPFEIKNEFAPCPYLLVLDQFVLHKLVMPPECYRAVHVRLGNDPCNVDSFPRLMLDPTNPEFLKEKMVMGYDGVMRRVFVFEFGESHIYFADKRVRRTVGFETIRALTEREKNFIKQKEREDRKASATDDALSESNTSDIFSADILNVGEQLVSIPFESTKYAASEAQVSPTKYSRITFQLIVPQRVKGITKMPTDEQEKREFLKKMKKEQREREKEEKAVENASRKAAKEAQSGTVAAEDASSESDGENGAEEGTLPSTQTQQDAHAENNDVFESSGCGHTDPKPRNNDVASVTESTTPNNAEVASGPLISGTNKMLTTKTRSFQIGDYLLNEENVPSSGITYSILFVSGEEIQFRARRVFLPSVCQFGNSGAAKTDVSLLEFKLNS